ncbi:energy transducer TonB [Sphingomonas daechungensis]|uniref:energy transducer TonB n=1 Tax=Sphingomonas daechungensis TaxID=1176646 RepID=UPI003782FF80
MIVRALTILSLLGIPAYSSASASIDPIGDWRIEPSEARCVVTRSFGDTKNPTTLALKAPPTGKALQLAIIRPAYRKTSSQVGAKVGIDGKTFDTLALGYPSSFPKASKTSVTLIHLPAEAIEALHGGRSMSVSAVGSVNETFPLGDIAKAWSALNDCLSRLRQAWNLDDDGRNSLVSDAKPLVPFEGMLSPRDFPPQAMSKPWSGTTKFLLLVDEKGIVRDCTLAESSGIAVIDSRTCAIISYKARFDPAIGPGNKPVKSAVARSITWRVIF